eukprot:2555963-Prymnesium_polylepis.1
MVPSASVAPHLGGVAAIKTAPMLVKPLGGVEAHEVLDHLELVANAICGVLTKPATVVELRPPPLWSSTTVAGL